MMNCDDARALVGAWEAGETPSRSPEELAAHLASCADCDERYGVLLPLVERDCREDTRREDTRRGAGEALHRTERSSVRDSALGDKVMSSLGSPGRRFLPFAPAAPARVLAAAAAAIFALGLSLGIYFARTGSDTVTVSFALEAPQASTVALAGDFNGWSGEGYQLRRAGKTGAWEIKVPLKRGKAYVYNFVIDGQTWIADPAVPARIDDGFGGSGSLLRL
ncbi:zf-HC2 domain-containing protein [bacterium]|nr:zf-HC2 domain-containing protein [bacterium]